ncbi:queuine tRNA-ribosyltransferase accessory subunit 2-like [Tubulanus polymorphus]|uniref:queuine tRNA-ribosyltransferase accessory subunit 2-like n=1 Tax=Tubulanus polymorphus TaxID=672921 RepID=UPI003DA3E130
MKFNVQTVKNGCRLGHLTEFKRNVENVVATPMCLLYTRGGSAPHLTLDMLKKIERVPAIVQLPMTLLADQNEIVEANGGGIGKFISMKDRILYCSLQDPTAVVAPGYNDKNGVSIWGRGGRVRLEPEDYVKVQEIFQPDFYQCLSDSDVNESSSRKRLQKSHERTINFLDMCLRKHQESENLDGVGILGVIVGGYDTEARIQSARQTATRPVSGFVIEGFHSYGGDCESFQISDVKELMLEFMKYLPDEKPRVMHGIWRPDQVVNAVECGVDIFDSSYAYVVTERRGALVFNHNYKNKNISNTPQHDDIENGDSSTHQINPFEIDLKDSRYFADFSPLVSDCDCYTCRTHTRSYIHHLINTSEMLAGVLLMMHNFHHYFAFFDSLRTALRDEEFESLKAIIEQQIPKTDTNS